MIVRQQELKGLFMTEYSSPSKRREALVVWVRIADVRPGYETSNEEKIVFCGGISSGALKRPSRTPLTALRSLALASFSAIVGDDGGAREVRGWGESGEWEVKTRESEARRR